MGRAFWHEVGRQLKNPSGRLGRLAGWLMRYANARSNALAVEALCPISGERILELGCGPGHALNKLLTCPEIQEVIGIDHSALMLMEARRLNRHARESHRLRLIECDFAAVPLSSGSIDGVLAVNVAYFMSDASAVAEAHRVLRGGGRLVVYATARESMRRWRFAKPPSHRLYDQIEIGALLCDGGFSRALIRISVVNAGFGVTGFLAVARKAPADSHLSGHPWDSALETARGGFSAQSAKVNTASHETNRPVAFGDRLQP
jgi:SAM-dependent methyltransferase